MLYVSNSVHILSRLFESFLGVIVQPKYIVVLVELPYLGGDSSISSISRHIPVYIYTHIILYIYSKDNIQSSILTNVHEFPGHTKLHQVISPYVHA